MSEYKLLYKYIFFGIGLLLISCLLYQVSFRVEPIYPVLTKRYQQLFHKKESIEAITIGSSHSVAIDFEEMNLKGYHLWDFGEDLFESEFKTRYVLNQLPHLKVVFLTLPYPIFVHDNTHSELGGMYRNRSRLHFVNETFNLIQYDVNALAKGKLAPIVRYDHWVFFPKHLFQEKKNIIPVKETLSIDYLAEDGNIRAEVAGFDNKKDLESIALLRLNDHLRYVSKTVALEPNIEAKTMASLSAIIQLLKEREIRLVLYTPPFYQSYLSNFPENLYVQFKQNLSEITATYGVRHFDYSNDADFVTQASYFQDGNHLSTKGAKAFSQQFAADLKKDSTRSFSLP